MIRITSSPAIRPASLVALRCESLKYAGQVITALVTGVPKNVSASRRSSVSTIAEISGGEYCCSPRAMRTSSCGPATTEYGMRWMASCVALADQRRPISRFTATTVRSALVTACLRASAPTSRLPLRAMATTEGVIRYPLRLEMTVGVPSCTVAQTELVVPRSMPMTSSPKVILQRPEERLGLLVIGVLVEKRGQLRPRSRLHARRHEQPREQPAGAAVVGIQLHRAGRPDGGGPGVARFHRAAGSAHGGSEARGVVLEGGRIGGDRLGETAPLFAFLGGRERRVGPGFGLLPLQLDQLGGDL